MKNTISHSALAKLESLDETGESLREFVDLFKSTAPPALKEISQQCAAKKAKELRGAAHRFKSSCAYLGAAQMAEACAQIEELALQEDFTSAAKLVSGLQGQYAEASAELSAYLKGKKGKK